MDSPEAPPDLPAAWQAALATARERRRVLVLGPTDVGKSAFVRTLLQANGDARLIDLDPGQKMIGPPGTLSRGDADRLHRMLFVGTTSASALSAIAGGARALAAGAEPSVANTAGFVTGPGLRLQAMTAEALTPDLVVEIGPAPILARPPCDLIRIAPSPFARRKTPGLRRRLRQEAFDRALREASALSLPEIDWAPAPPVPFATPARPVCALADAEGEDMTIGIVREARAGSLVVHAPPPPRPVHTVRLGRMWAMPGEQGWRLAERLEPSWQGS